jgi:Flp pilus assembly secretin CpaC
MFAFARLCLVLVASLLSGAAQVALAQTSEPVQLTPGFTKLIRFDHPIATVVIGNPEVADARAQTDRSIALVGKAVGITNLIALDNTGAEVFSSLVVVGARDAGKVIINARKTLHEYWAYRCTGDNCVRVEDKLEYLQPAAPIVVAPVSPNQAPPP